MYDFRNSYFYVGLRKHFGRTIVKCEGSWPPKPPPIFDCGERLNLRLRSSEIIAKYMSTFSSLALINMHLKTPVSSTDDRKTRNIKMTKRIVFIFIN